MRPAARRVRWAAGLFCSALLCAAVGPGGLAAQDRDPPPEAAPLDSLRAAFRLEVPPDLTEISPSYRPVPAMGANSPTAFGAQWGDLFVGAGFAPKARLVEDHDGSFGVGFGIGNAWTLAGLEVSAISFSTFRSGWGNRLGVDLKLHRILPGSFAVAVGWESALLRGVTDGLRSKFFVVSRWFQLREDDTAPFSAMTLSVGVGNGRFQSVEDLQAVRNRIGYFGSAAVRVLQPLSVIADWTGPDLVLATSLAPFDRHAVTGTIGLADVAGNLGDGARLVFSGGYSYRFGRP